MRGKLPEGHHGRGKYWSCCLSLITLLLLLPPPGVHAAPVTDDRGAAVALAAPPQRIISLYGGLTEILTALGVADRLRPSRGFPPWAPICSPTWR
jgi:ABC-type Fe3+-hydroxamate transport system substrate-binding protein